VDTYLAAREALLSSAEPGRAAARRLSDLTDEAVRELSLTASSRFFGRFALVALGGWGCGAMQPMSDLDILVLSDASAAKVKPLVEAVLYPLWDAGLDVGHQVRSPREQMHAMRVDLATCTAALTARPFAGDIPWAENALAACAADAHKRARTLLRELATRPRPGSPYLLQPDLKDGAGGRRDYDELTWTAALLSGAVQRDPSALVSAGILTADEYAALDGAARTLARARWCLGVLGAGNLLSLDTLADLPDGLAEDTQTALATSASLLTRARRRAQGDAVEPDDALTPDEVFALLDAGEAGLESLEVAAQSGRLETLAPGFRDLMTLRRPGLGHQLTVGAHSLRAASIVTSLPAESALARSAAAIEHPRTLQVAALAHDVGKALPGDHALAGAPVARDIARRFGLDDHDVDDVADLVAGHLLLAEIANHIDIDDEDAVLSAAARIRRRELLAPLHVLTAADSLATGPATWSAWTAALIGSLVARLDAALSADVDGAGLATRGESVRSAALLALGDDQPETRTFVHAAPLRYLAGRQPADVTRDARLATSLASSGAAYEVRTAVSPGLADATYALTVIALDRPQLLARIAGAISLAGLDILAVDAYGARNGIVLDTFTVTSATLRPVTAETFTGLDRLLVAALRDRLELRTRLAERRRHYPARSQAPLEVQVVSAGYDTAVRVSAPDRPGLLHDLAQAVSATDLNIRWAKVVTVDGMAIDTFHVVNADGEPADDGTVGHLSMRIREIR